MFTVQDIGRRYGVTDRTVLGWIRSGELRAVNVGRQSGAFRPRWRIPQAALDAFESLRAAAPPPPTPVRRKRPPPGVIEFYR
jgi:excisionase family DNA binding protein